ncbi:helix-turn-helix domain-containing protein [Planktotalea sp.]|uniref:helix-turn-helix domain-containing protein n=1 Tax=Planktotalea sp. TaxID=2029877 RepID=UPI00329A40AF
MPAISELFQPPAALSGLILAGIYRDTRGVELSDADRLNHFPASPLVPVTFLMEGAIHVLPTGQDWRSARDAPALERVSVRPIQDTPLSSWSPAGTKALTLGLYPDAWLSLGGDLEYQAVPMALHTALEEFADAPTPARGWEAFCANLAPVWAQQRASTWRGTTLISDWIRSMITRSALTGAGQSLRSIERRTKRLSGQTRRTLEFFSAMESLQKIAYKNQDMPLADIAYEAGYSDQSHMGRAVRRATGFSPAQLNHAIQTEEAFWCYRLLGERY